MVFSSVTFLFLFLPAVYLLYLMIPWPKGRNALLLAASLFFYAWGEAWYVVLMFVSALANWGMGLLISRQPEYKKLLVAVAAVLNLGLLIFFKYTGLLLELFNLLPGISMTVAVPHLPVGISFFTFQALSYVIDISRRPELVQKNFGKLFLYIAFFPQLIAGPIVKYYDIATQLDHREISIDATAVGIRRFICGLAKKLLIADVMAVVADAIFSDPLRYEICAAAWLGAIAYVLQIYFDFSGYSDMAVGLGKMFGFHFQENFRYPYSARGIQDFWRKWHISLSTWFREYLYIPLGGNRKSQAFTCRNLMIVFLLTGLWHGAAYTFIVWGVFHGILLILERLKIIWILRGKFSFLTHIYTILAVTVGFVIFRADSMQQAGKYLISMFRFGEMAKGASLALVYCNPYLLFTFVVAIVTATPILPALKHHLEGSGRCWKGGAEAAAYVGSILLFTCCVMAVASNAYSPFIYFRF